MSIIGLNNKEIIMLKNMIVKSNYEQLQAIINMLETEYKRREKIYDDI